MKILKTLSLLFFTLNLFSQCPPDVQASIIMQTLTCNSPTLLATGTSTTPNTQISWLVLSTPSLINSSTVIIGPPNGPPTSSLTFIYANYTVVATNTLLGCISNSVIQINQNFKPPFFELKPSVGGPPFICNSTGMVIVLNYTNYWGGNPLFNLNCCWYGPSPQTTSCNITSYRAYTDGNYTVTAIDNYNGCSNTKTIQVTDSRPQLNLSGIAPTSSVSCNGSLNINTQIPNGYSLTTTSGSLSGNTVSNLCYGWIKVCITYTDTQCFKCDSLLMNAATSINELNYENEISIYPNLTSSSVFIQHPSNISGTITLLNIEGKEIKSLSFKESENTKITNLEAGIYFLEIGINHSIMRRKLMVLR